jgi:hypothetical protein
VKKPEKGSAIGEPFQDFSHLVFIDPTVVATLQPWAEISERLRRNELVST